MCWVLKPPPLHHIIPNPVPCPQASQVLPLPLPAFAGTQVKISFFLLFHFFSDQCYRDPLYPTCQVLKPPPLHHIIPTPMPHPSSLASPHCSLCLTACKPSHLHLRHMQVCHHCHPITACKIHP